MILSGLGEPLSIWRNIMSLRAKMMKRKGWKRIATSDPHVGQWWKEMKQDHPNVGDNMLKFMRQSMKHPAGS